MGDDITKELRKLPSVDRLLNLPAVQTLVEQHGHELVVSAIQDALAAARQTIQQGAPRLAEAGLAELAARHLTRLLRASLYPVINATGVIIHTNLGRAPLSLEAQQAMRAAGEYCNLEYDLDAGERSSRYVHAERLLCRLTGAEAALVVNNDAAAVLLILAALARGREVIISRGQLVEIGGGFRIPEVMAQSGARLVEVGTTNRTYLADYQGAIGPASAVLLHVHTSNFRVIGFVHETPLDQLANLARTHHLAAVDDLGSGALLDTAQFGLGHEVTVQQSLSAGADLVCFSGDKLLGGPQAGIIVGSGEHLAVLKGHPLTRALRVNKTVLAGLQATLLHYLKGEAVRRIPVWQMIAMAPEEVDARAVALLEWLRKAGARADVVDGLSTVGGGALPGETLPTRLVALHVDSPQMLAKRLRLGSPPVVGRIDEDALVLDLRTVLPSQEAALRGALGSAL
jgi:L-seryl-tRNA(Ser) seleniumtransferase